MSLQYSTRAHGVPQMLRREQDSYSLKRVQRREGKNECKMATKKEALEEIPFPLSYTHPRCCQKLLVLLSLYLWDEGTESPLK